MQVSMTAPISAIPVRSPSHGSEGCDGPADHRLLAGSGSSFPLTPCSGRRGRRFKSGHPDRKTTGHKASIDLPFALRVPGCPILAASWERRTGDGGPLGPRRALPGAATTFLQLQGRAKRAMYPSDAGYLGRTTTVRPGTGIACDWRASCGRGGHDAPCGSLRRGLFGRFRLSPATITGRAADPQRPRAPGPHRARHRHVRQARPAQELAPSSQCSLIGVKPSKVTRNGAVASPVMTSRRPLPEADATGGTSSLLEDVQISSIPREVFSCAEHQECLCKSRDFGGKLFSYWLAHTPIASGQ